MPTVPVPRVTGQTVAEAPLPGVRVSGGNPDFGQSVGAAVSNAGLMMVANEAKKQAESDALKYSIEGRDAIDALHLKAMQPVELPDGSLDFSGPLKQYEADAQKVIREMTAKAKHPLAQRATLDSLSSYAQSQRGKLATLAREQAQKNEQAFAMNRGEAVLQNPTLTREERDRELLVAAKSLQVRGGMDSLDALKQFQKWTREGETFDWLTRVNAAGSDADLDKLTESLQAEGRPLGPEGMLKIRAEVDRKREAMAKQQERAQKADQEAVDKMFTDLAAKGLLTPAIVESQKHRLDAASYRRWAGEPDKVSQRVAEGVDDPDIYRDVQGKVIAASKNAAALESLRGRIRDLMTGYDPVTRKVGRPGLSRDTALRLLNQTEGYIADIRTQARTTNEGEKGVGQKRTEVESWVRDHFKRYIESRGLDRDAVKSAQDRLATSLEDLTRNGAKDPLKWFDDWKKAHDDIVKARTALPSFVPRAASGTPDFAAARKQLADDFRNKRGGPGGRAMTQPEYDARFRTIEKLEREYAK